MYLAALRARPRTVRFGCFLFALATVSAPAAAADEQAEATVRIGDVAYRRVEVRTNDFTSSQQDRVALDQDARGETVVVWQSRRQESGTYGVYARRFDAKGRALTGEVRVNTTTAGMQMEPAVAIDAEGGVWFAWYSFGQDGHQGAIVARRFDPRLETATPEVVVDTQAFGNQCEPSLAALDGGRAVVVWTSPVLDEQGLEAGSRVLGRFLGADGKPLGDELTVPTESGVFDTLPVVANGSEGLLVAWARCDASTYPVGIFGRRFDAGGRPLGPETRLDASPQGTYAIEPALAASGATFAVAWLQSTADGFAIRTRLASASDGGELELDPVREVESRERGYVNGVAVDVDAGLSTLVSWTQFGDGPEHDAGLFARVHDARGKPAGAAFRVTALEAGEQRLAPAAGTRRAAFGALGQLAFAWTGEAGLGDESGAHLTLLLPDGFEAEERVARAAAASPRFEEQDTTAPLPHDPPIYDPLASAPPETDVRMEEGSSGDFDFLAISMTPWTPPDPHMSVGPGHIVAITNGEIAFFDKAGTNLFRDEIEDSFGFWGGLGADNFVFDPETIYDPHSGRFMAMACERSDTGTAYYLLAISDDSDPVGTWHKYRINATASAGDTDIDSPNLAADENVIYLSSDFFGPDKFHIMMIDKSSVIDGGTPVFTDELITGDQSMGFPVTYDTGAPAQYMVGYEPSTSTRVRLYAITNPLTTPVIQSVFVTVPTYTHPEDPPQLGTSTRPETFEARFWSAVYRDGRLWATHHVDSARIRQRWYEFDMASWPISGTPTLVQSGEVDLGGSIRTFFGSIWVDENGTMALTYARSAPDERISMERTWRAAGDPDGTTRPPVSVITSTSASSSRWGDYSAVVDDPVDSNVFWAHHEYHTSGWRTRIARFTSCSGTVSNYCAVNPNSTGFPAIIGSSGSTSVAQNDFGVYATGCPPGQSGIFFYGASQAEIPFGNGFLCVSGQLFRLLPPLTTDAFGIAQYQLDLTTPPPGGAITPGSSWSFQFWFRDPPAGGAFFNTSNALTAEFCD